MENIPEKWCVLRTPENAEVLNAWANDKVECSLGESFFDSDEYMTHHPGVIGYPSDKIPEITFLQWQTINSEWVKENCSYTFERYPKLVLGRPKKILGYVFKEDITPSIKKAAGIIAHMDSCPGPDYDFTEAQLDSALFFPDSPTHKVLERAGVMHWFKIKYTERFNCQ